MEALIKSIQLNRQVQRFRVPQLRPIIRGVSALMAYWVIDMQLQKYNESSELELKKERLSMPVYELSEEDYLNPPWAGDNYDQWKYRLVKIKGRQIHRQTMPIPRTLHEYEGYDYIVPIVHQEKDDFSDQVGLLLNKGFIPHEYKEIGNRNRVEDAETHFQFVGMVTKGEDLKSNNPFRKGNVFDEQRWIWNSLDLKQMARAVGFANREAANQAIIEIVDLKETPLDEKDSNHYKKNMSGTETFPYPKTLSGALQPAVPYSKVIKDQLGFGILAILGFIY